MPSIDEVNTADEMPVKVLVIGGSYGGLAAALNLLDLCKGRTARFRAVASLRMKNLHPEKEDRICQSADQDCRRA